MCARVQGEGCGVCVPVFRVKGVVCECPCSG